MSRTLYIVEDDVTKGLGGAILAKMLDETKSICAFIKNFTVVMTAADKFPPLIDFTDAIVKAVAKDADVTPMENQAKQQQRQSIDVSLKAKGLNVKSDQLERNTANPDRGGVGWHGKHIVAVNGKKAALVKTGGLVSLETVNQTVLTYLAPNNWSMDDAERAKTKTLNNARLLHGKDQESEIKRANERFAKSKNHWDLKAKAPKDWPPAYQETFGIALGRIVAHEARHQYVGPHFDEGGLGGDAPELLGMDKSAKFLADDQK
jgi:hypothetical protein